MVTENNLEKKIYDIRPVVIGTKFWVNREIMWVHISSRVIWFGIRTDVAILVM